MSSLVRLGRFGAISALGMGLQLTVLWVLVGEVGTHYLPATLVAVSAAIAHNFLWHRRWTWRDRKTRGWPAFARFVFSNGLVSLAGQAAAVTVLVEGLGLRPVAANFGAVAACGLVNFALADRLVFRRWRPAELVYDRAHAHPCLLSCDGSDARRRGRCVGRAQAD